MTEYLPLVVECATAVETNTFDKENAHRYRLDRFSERRNAYIFVRRERPKPREGEQA